MTVLVVGATGQLGGDIARRLLQQGSRPVRTLVRPASDHESLASAGAELAFGDLKQPDTLAAVCRGVETVITTANSAQRGGADTPETVDLVGNRYLIEAARSAGARQFIFISALGADAASPVPFMRAKGQTEATLRDSGLSYTILAPDMFMEVWMGLVIGLPLQHNRPVTLVAGGQRRHSFISMRDVASFAVAAIDHPAAQNRYLALGGPVAVSFSEAVAVVQRVLARSMPVQSIKPGESVPGMPESVQPLYWMIESFDSAVDMVETARTFGIHLTSVENYLRQAFVPAATA